MRSYHAYADLGPLYYSSLNGADLVEAVKTLISSNLESREDQIKMSNWIRVAIMGGKNREDSFDRLSRACAVNGVYVDMINPQMKVQG